MIKLPRETRDQLATRLAGRGLDLGLRFATPRDVAAVFAELGEMGYPDTRVSGERAAAPDYRELGFDRKASPPTDDDRERYRRVTRGAELGEDGFVCQVLLMDTDLLPDRYAAHTFRSLVGLKERYLGRANDINHSMSARDAGGRVIDMWIGVDEGVLLHQDHPTEAVVRYDPYLRHARSYAALGATVAFPRVNEGARAIDDIRSGLVRDVSIAWSSGAFCSECMVAEDRRRPMIGFLGLFVCEEHGLAGGRDAETGRAVVAVYEDVRDAFTYGHVANGACRRASYVLDPDI